MNTIVQKNSLTFFKLNDFKKTVKLSKQPRINWFYLDNVLSIECATETMPLII